MMPRRTSYNKRDANERAILSALTKLGIQYWEGPPLDFWCWLPGRGFVPVEVKTPQGKLTPGQQVFMDSCAEEGRPCLLWRSVDDAITAVNTVHYAEWAYK